MVTCDPSTDSAVTRLLALGWFVAGMLVAFILSKAFGGKQERPAEPAPPKAKSRGRANLRVVR